MRTPSIIDSVLDFQEITIRDKALFDDYLKMENARTSELTFTNLFVWREHYGFRHTILHDLLIVIACAPEEPFAFFPLGLGEAGAVALRNALVELKAHFERESHPLQLGRADHRALAALQEAGISFRAERDEANDDYVYRTEDLSTLRGKKYDGKRNHIRRLLNHHGTDYAPVTPYNLHLAERVISFWFAERGDADSSTDPEKAACRELLENFDALACPGGLLLVDGEPAAVTFGELLNKNTAVIHFEKAVGPIDGAYPLINQSFVHQEWNQTEFMNREQDLGLPGLRRAKQSYHPDHMVEKYKVYL